MATRALDIMSTFQSDRREEGQRGPLKSFPGRPIWNVRMYSHDWLASREDGKLHLLPKHIAAPNKIGTLFLRRKGMMDIEHIQDRHLSKLVGLN